MVIVDNQAVSNRTNFRKKKDCDKHMGELKNSASINMMLKLIKFMFRLHLPKAIY